MDNSPSRSRLPLIIVLILVLGVVSFVFSKLNFKGNSENVFQPTPATASTFAAYEEVPVKVTPRVAPYEIKPDLSNISNVSDFSFSPEAKNLLVKNGFVVTPGYHPEFFPLYEQNRYAYTPNFITTDSMLHNYHLFFDFILKRTEEERLAAELKRLNSGMLAEAKAQYESLKGSEWENAAKRNLGFFTVGSKLLDPATPIPVEVKNEVEQELALIAAHKGIDMSPLMNLGSDANIIEAAKEDYSQYIPRGHYDRTDELKNYFKSMMWYGRLTFRLKETDEIKSALLITQAIGQGDNQETWSRIYEPVNFFVGKSDDITYFQFKDLAERIYGGKLTLKNLQNEDKFAAFVKATEELDPPEINSIPVFNSDIQPDREREIKGFRFMGQRFTIDAAIFQRLIDREVPDRLLPKGLDIPAALGSEEALKILTDMGETKYPKYLENMGKLQTHLSGLSESAWTQNLYWGWLNALRPLVGEKPEGYPSFMRNLAWTRKELNTFLGSWTELKHDTILYAKQVYAEMGGGGPEVKDDRGYVEPNPYVYARLASLLKMTSEGLETRALLNPATKENLSRLYDLAISLKTISEKELNGEKLSDQEYELIRSYGGQLEHFWLEVNKDEPAFQQSGRNEYLNENPAALVSDVATDPNGSVLEEATGKIANIYVVVPVEGGLRIASGGTYSYYEFPWPISDRLTDKAWRAMLEEGKQPPLPSWTDAFVAKN